jgi:hypothetical protein
MTVFRSSQAVHLQPQITPPVLAFSLCRRALPSLRLFQSNLPCGRDASACRPVRPKKLLDDLARHKADRAPLPDVPEPSPASEEQIREAVVRKLIEGRTSMGVFFISVDGENDPDDGFLAHFSDLKAPIRKGQRPFRRPGHVCHRVCEITLADHGRKGTDTILASVIIPVQGP